MVPSSLSCQCRSQILRYATECFATCFYACLFADLNLFLAFGLRLPFRASLLPLCSDDPIAYTSLHKGTGMRWSGLDYRLLLISKTATCNKFCGVLLLFSSYSPIRCCGSLSCSPTRCFGGFSLLAIDFMVETIYYRGLEDADLKFSDTQQKSFCYVLPVFLDLLVHPFIRASQLNGIRVAGNFGMGNSERPYSALFPMLHVSCNPSTDWSAPFIRRLTASFLLIF